MGILEDKVAIVTGSGHGIGRGHAMELARQGAKVVVNDLGSSVSGDGEGRDADLTVELIEKGGGEAIADYEDVADFAGAERLVQRAIDTYGRLDILVNNAGIVRDGMLHRMDEAAWDAVVRVHLKGTFAPLRHAAAYWRAEVKQGRPVAGRVINTTSGAGLSGNVGQVNYTAAKAGIVGLTLTASLELARVGVTVNCVAPGGTTRIMGTIPGAGVEVKEPDEYDEWHPLDPKISSPLVAWLASDEAGHVSGQVLRAIGETIVLLEGWRYGPTISNGGGEHWDAGELGARIATDVFRSRAPGLRPG